MRFPFRINGLLLVPDPPKPAANAPPRQAPLVTPVATLRRWQWRLGHSAGVVKAHTRSEARAEIKRELRIPSAGRLPVECELQDCAQR